MDNNCKNIVTIKKSETNKNEIINEIVSLKKELLKLVKNQEKLLTEIKELLKK